MKRFMGAFRMDLKRAFINPVFIATIFLMMCLFFVNDFINNFELSWAWERKSISMADGQIHLSVFDVWYSDVVAGYSIFATTIAALPYAHSFCTDFENRNFRSVVIRTGTECYTASKIITVFLSAYAVYFAASLLYSVFIYFFMFLITGQFLLTTSPQAGASTLSGMIINQFGDYAAILIDTAVRGIEMGIWALGALCVSAFTESKFLVIVSPYLLVYYVRYFSLYLPLSDLYIHSVFSLDHLNSGIAIPGYLVTLLYTLLLTTLFSYIFVNKAKRRIYYG